ncbi:hypothetical protein PAEPH01_2262 [Pancytospora epiphaga]|nr:hypothetical protein PAEPH01_2262 [Pancytospora epiphaga]
MNNVSPAIESRVGLKRLLSNAKIYYVLHALYILTYGSLHFSISTETDDDIYKNLDREFFFYILSYNIFAFFLVLKANITRSIYEYYVAIIILFKKLSTVTTAYLESSGIGCITTYNTFPLLILLNSLELFYLCANLYIKSSDIGYYMFKLTGVAPHVNSKCNFYII